MLFSIFVLIILISINGIFSASELAFLSIDKYWLKKETENGNKKAKMIFSLLEDSSSFLSTIQIGITLAGFLASAFAADYFADYFMAIISINFLSKTLLRKLLVVLITVILSYFTLVFGELVPKKLAINNPYKVASKFVGLIRIVKGLFNPLIKILTKSTELVCKLLKIEEKEDKLTEEDIKKMVILGKDQGIIEAKEKEYILNIFNFNDIEVDKVMTPRKDVVLLNIEDDVKKNILKIKRTKYSRFPVYKQDKNNIIGLINVKDIIFQKKNDSEIDLNKIIRPIHKFKHNEMIDDVFRFMQENNESLCAVFEENQFVGVVTVEDAVEEIVGNIYDEYD